MAFDPKLSTPGVALRIARSTAVVGLVAVLGAASVTFVNTIGLMPWWLYGPVARHLSTEMTLHRVPIEFGGAMWFTAVLILSTFTRQLERERVAFICVGSALVTGAGVWLTFTRMPVPLLTAVGALAAMVTLVACGTTEFPRRERGPVFVDALRRTLGDPTTRARLGVWAALLTLVVAVVSGEASRRSQTEVRQQNFARWFAHQSSASSMLRSSDEINITVFTDYQCPLCRAFTAKVPALIARLQREAHSSIRLHLRDYPLDSACNPAFPATQSLHPAACRAAVAVRYVISTKGVEAANELARELSRIPMAATDPDVDRLVADQRFVVVSARLLKDVAADVNFGNSIGVTGTPTAFVDGVRLPKPDINLLEMAVRVELHR